MEKVQILMSTYNGASYLKTQLDSILNQTYTNFSILVRDDGSTDETLAILRAYSEEYSNVSYYQGENISVIQSFLELLRGSDDDAAYYGFADQDDEWMPEKIERAIEKMQACGGNQPLLYCSDTYLADSELAVIGKDEKCARPSLGNALVQNICTGCTAVMNHRLRDIINRTSPKNIIMHDWWFYISAALFGGVCYDTEAYIKYRQHGNNQFGAKTSKKEIWKHRIGQLFEKRGELYEQLREIQRNYTDIDEEQARLIELVLRSQKGFGNRVRLVRNKEIYRNKPMDDRIYRGIVMIGKL